MSSLGVVGNRRVGVLFHQPEGVPDVVRKPPGVRPVVVDHVEGAREGPAESESRHGEGLTGIGMVARPDQIDPIERVRIALIGIVEDIDDIAVDTGLAPALSLSMALGKTSPLFLSAA